ncbi:MAG TPA: hypothetical protein DCE55_24170 [Planctomycetaceae bacterium]|nr:hypothetical protein [Planctomycetaceae bacterium]|tara:strand:- start:576 stop:1715 length:1140 start_codon:yes stop_codon:yes gene_type:complete
MSLIDRYICWLFLRVSLCSAACLIGLIVLIDVAGNFEEFIGFGDHSLHGFLRVIGTYYLARSLIYFDWMSALIALMSTIFVMTWLKRTNEMAALMAAGIPSSRIVKPLIIAAVAVATGAALNREFLLPRFSDELSRNAQDLRGTRKRPLEPKYDAETDILLAGHHTLAAQQQIVNAAFQLPQSVPGYGRKLVAKTASYRPPYNDRPGGYLLSGITQPESLSKLPTLTITGRPVVYSPIDTDWLEENQCFVVSKVTFQQLAGGKAWQRYAPTWHLISALRNPSLDYGADLRVTVHQRLLRPFLDISLLLLGLPIVLSRNHQSLFVAVGQCLLLVAAYYLLTMVFEWMGSRSYLLTPAQAAWGPLIVLAPFAYTVSKRMWN